MRNALKGALTALVSSLLVALLFAYTFRLPIPLGAIIGPFGQLSSYTMSIGDVLWSVLGAWLFYGVFYGFIIVPLCGAVAGTLAGRRYPGAANKVIILWAALASVIPVFCLSILDWIIGPW